MSMGGLGRRLRLSPAELAAARTAARGSVSARRAWAEEFDPEVFKAWRGWTWGRHAFDLSTFAPDDPPPMACKLFDLEAIEYRAAKKDPDGKARRVVYRHEFDRPFASLVTSGVGARELLPEVACPVVSTRGVSFRGPALFELGELHAVEGTAADGSSYYWRAPAGWLLVGCPWRDTMHVLRPAGRARELGPPLWIVRGRSRYTLTDRGIER